MNDSRKDPAERSGYLRFFYKGWRPTTLGKVWSRIMAWMSALGLMPEVLISLEVKSRRTGRHYSTVLVGANYDGHRYLVSMLGNGSEWVQDVRAAEGEAIIRRFRARPVMLVEIPLQQRAPVLKAWCQVATSGRRHLPISHDAPISAFEDIAPDYPVFRIDPIQR